MSAAIRIENLSKQYRLGTVGTGTISHDLNRWWHRARGKEDPYAKVGQVNDREQDASNDGAPEYVWALRDINLEVEQGEILGIIGRNGAGKSTLLKLLSRVTAPTSGTIRTRGRIASLLEVGTGFHPELTGRENIYLNGSIMGMKRREISQHLDEIVDFSGCAKYLDTPTKRYSSGMTVRLGFAVAAYLSCEILIVDEVLAVGDAEFQEKCIGKMKDISGSGRTVLFVSHNMAAVTSICKSAVCVNQGQIADSGTPSEVAGRYLARGIESSKTDDWGKGAHTQIKRVHVKNSHTPDNNASTQLELEADVWTDGTPGMSIEFFLNDETLSRVGMNSLHQFYGLTLPNEPGEYRYTFQLHPITLAAGRYSLGVHTSITNIGWDHCVETAASFTVPYCSPGPTGWDLKQALGFGKLALTAPEPKVDRLK